MRGQRLKWNNLGAFSLCREVSLQETPPAANKLFLKKRKLKETARQLPRSPGRMTRGGSQGQRSGASGEGRGLTWRRVWGVLPSYDTIPLPGCLGKGTESAGFKCRSWCSRVSGCAALRPEARWGYLFFIFETGLEVGNTGRVAVRWCCRGSGVLPFHRCQRSLTPPQQQTNSLDTKGTCTVITTPKRRADIDVGPHLRPTGSGRTSYTHCTGARMEK